MEVDWRGEERAGWRRVDCVWFGRARGDAVDARGFKPFNFKLLGVWKKGRGRGKKRG
jgi:hypothetical protein